MAENMLRPTAQKRDRYWCYYLVFAASVLVPVLLLSTIYSPRHLCKQPEFHLFVSSSVRSRPPDTHVHHPSASWPPAHTPPALTTTPIYAGPSLRPKMAK